MKSEIIAKTKELGGMISYQGSTKTFYVEGKGVITKLKPEFANSGFEFKRKTLTLKNTLKL